MYGLGGTVQYRECSRCGSLATVEVPDGLGRYYPPGYYSFAMPEHGGSDGAAFR